MYSVNVCGVMLYTYQCVWWMRFGVSVRLCKLQTEAVPDNAHPHTKVKHVLQCIVLLTGSSFYDTNPNTYTHGTTDVNNLEYDGILM